MNISVKEEQSYYCCVDVCQRWELGLKHAWEGQENRPEKDVCLQCRFKPIIGNYVTLKKSLLASLGQVIITPVYHVVDCILFSSPEIHNFVSLLIKFWLHSFYRTTSVNNVVKIIGIGLKVQSQELAAFVKDLCFFLLSLLGHFRSLSGSSANPLSYSTTWWFPLHAHLLVQ